METHVANKAIAAFIALNVFGVCYLYSRAAPRDQFATIETARMAGALQDEGVMPTVDYVHLTDIGDKIDAFGEVSDEDLRWMLNAMRAPLHHDNQDAALLHMEVLVRLRRARRLTPAQRTRIYDAMFPLLSSSGKSGLDRCQAAKTLGMLGDKRAIPHLTPLLRDPPYCLIKKSNFGVLVASFKNLTLSLWF